MTDQTTRAPLGRRQRRMLLTAGLVCAAAIAGAAGFAWIYRHQRSAQYRPGEANADITQSLSRNLPADAPAPKFVDVTREAGLDGFVTFAGARSSQLPEDMGPGAAWGDYDNDGDDDLFLVSAGGPLTGSPEQWAPSALFENLGDGRFRRVAGFPEPRIIGFSAAWGDADGDGWIDLIVTGYNTLLLYRNERGRFLRDARFASRDGFWTGAVWGDYDNDGDLDLYVCGYVRYAVADAHRETTSSQYGQAVPYTLNPASYEPERNLLFRQNGAGTFAEVADKLGVANPQGRSMSALWHDFDDDGWLDLYVANDISDNAFFHNVGGRFEDISHPAWVADYRGAMGLAAGDWDRDGDDDLFITHWIAQENALYNSLLKDTPRAGAATAAGGQLRFVDLADRAGLGQIALPMVGWGTEFVDVDADGWLDLVVANGSTIETAETPKGLKPQLPFLFWNRRGEFFYDLAPLVPPLATPHVARGLAVSDFDNDGDMDILIARHGEGVQLLRNEMQTGQWAEVVLRARSPGRPSTRPAIGAQAVAHVGEVVLRRSVTGASYLSQSTATLHFGLGNARLIDRLEVRWRGNEVTTYTGLAAGRKWEIVQGDPIPRDITGRPTSPGGIGATGPAAALTDRERVLAFWASHRAGMAALRVDHNCPRAIALFQEALTYDPTHEDARYYLGNCLAAEGDTDGALEQYAHLTRQNAASPRAHAGWGTLRAMTARSAADLASAEEALAKAYRLNPEETGVLTTLGEVALMRSQPALARQRLVTASSTNPRAVGALFLLGYLQWTQGDAAGAAARLTQARRALGPDWKPSGATAEGDATRKTHTETTPLSRFWAQWNGASAPGPAYGSLDAYLKTVPR